MRKLKSGHMGHSRANCKVKGCREHKEETIPFRKIREVMPEIMWGQSLAGDKPTPLCHDHYHRYLRARRTYKPKQ